MNTTLKRILCVILALILVLVLFLCIKNSKPADTSEDPEVATENTADQDNEIFFYEESDSAVIVPQKKAVDEFIGSWTATSARASYQYGMVNITIEEGGTWNGYIAYEDLKGTWTEIEDGIHLTSDLFDGDLKFTKDDVLVMLYSPNEDGNYLVTVLTAE